MKWLHKNGETHIDGFDFKKLPRLDKGNEAIRRATLSNDEYEALYRAMRSYTAKHNKQDDAELRVRKIVQHYVLIAANSGLRVGEQRQLRWSDVQIEQHKVNGEQQKLARIHVRAEPPHLNWSSAMFRKRRTDNDEQTTEAGRDYHEVEAS
jgi:integrase